MAVSVRLFLVAAALLRIRGSPPPPLPFTCCTGQASCGSAINDPVVCAALGELYYSTNGPGWYNRVGWSSAAAGTPTSYCNFHMTQGRIACNSQSVLNTMCVSLGKGARRREP